MQNRLTAQLRGRAATERQGPVLAAKGGAAGEREHRAAADSAAVPHRLIRIQWGRAVIGEGAKKAVPSKLAIKGTQQPAEGRVTFGT